jgi:diguanylate cyclase (GGDEF)-like protein/PAS domain S-box-containing protein
MMDLAIARSVLKHPFRRGVAIFAADGTTLGHSAAAQQLIPAIDGAAVREALSGWRELLTQYPDRVLNDVLVLDDRHLHGEMRAVLDADRQLIAFTFSAVATDTETNEAGRTGALQLALELGDAGICDWDMARGRVVYSHNWLSIVGYAAGELSDSSDEWLSRVHPDDLARVNATLAECLRGRSNLFACEHRLRTRDGQWRWVADRGHVIGWQADGAPQRMLISTQDITAYKELESRLREHEALLQKAQAVGKIGSWAYDPIADVSWWSEQMYRIYGLSPASTQHDRANHLKLYTPESQQRLNAALEKSLETGAPYDLELEFVRTDGAHRWIAARAEVLRDEGGWPRLIGVVQDITDQRDSEAQSRWNTKMLAQISSMGKIGGYEWTIDGEDVQWTDQVYRITGLPLGTALTKTEVKAMYESTSRERLEDAIQQVIATGMPVNDLELALFTPDGRRVWLRCAAELEYENNIPHRIVGLIQDITEEHEAGERIEQLAHYDSLTGLPNRFLFHQRARDAINDARRSKAMLALLFIDLDRFKNINDSMGHAIGDQLLFEVGGRLRACVRSHDVIGRLSGDEFLILLRDIRRPDDAAVVARKILASLQEPIALAGVDLHIGASIGIALWNDSSADLDDLMRAADTAMYAAKDLGRNTFQFYTDAFLERVQRRLTVENELRTALRRDEFRLAYQPTVKGASGETIGIEALLRWTTAAGESRPPDEFIAVAEDSGEIIPIGDWVLTEACRQAAVWAAGGLAFARIAVNVSAVQLRDPDFAERVLRICAATAWDPKRLELELTESALMRDTDTLRQAFTLFEQHGVRLAVDDFGTGFSNLHYLTRFPVQHLKIDRSFVQTMLTDSTTRELTQVVIGLGHALNMSVVAEGVETSEQMQALQQQGCDEFQGYLFSRPLFADAMEVWLRERQSVARTPSRTDEPHE